jgi:hypothetical protein
MHLNIIYIGIQLDITYLVILFKQLYMFWVSLAHPQEFLHCMVSHSLWQMCGCVVVWLGIRWLVWCGPSSDSTLWVELFNSETDTCFACNIRSTPTTTPRPITASLSALRLLLHWLLVPGFCVTTPQAFGERRARKTWGVKLQNELVSFVQGWTKRCPRIACGLH